MELTFVVVEDNLASQIRFYLDAKRRRWRPKTLESYSSILNLYAAHVGPGHWPPSLNGVTGWLGQVERSGCSPSTIHSYWTHLRSFFNYLEKAGILLPIDNPAWQMERLELAPESPDLPPVAFPPEDMARLFEHLADQIVAGASLTLQKAAIRDLALVRFAYVTGARAGEIAGLALDQLDLPGCRALILAQTSKGKKFRPVFFDDAVCQAFEDWLAIRQPVSPDVNQVFTSLGGHLPRGSALTTHALNGMLRRLCKRAGVTRRKFHALRHTSVLDALDEGISPDKVQKQLGHASIQTTLNYMRGRDEDRARDYREKSLLASLPKRAARRTGG